MTTQAQEAALALLQSIAETEEKISDIQMSIKGVWSQADCFPGIPDDVHEKSVALIDAVLGENEIATYWLYDCRRQGMITIDGVEWPITSVDDIRRYLNREK